MKIQDMLRPDFSPTSTLLLDDSRPVSNRVLIACAVVITAAYALLWTRYLYPLADSALYLGLARSIADGNGFMFMDVAYKRITPLHPLLLAAIIKLGGGIGAMHAANIILMLVSHVLCFFTIRRWFNDRLALLATIATAAQFWVFRNSMFILTEPLFMLMVWAGLLPLAYVNTTEGTKRWIMVILGCVFLAGAFETRVAGIFLLPPALAALWLSNGKVPWQTRALWMAVFGVVFSILVYQFWRSPYPEGMAPPFIEREGRSELARASMSAEERYSPRIFQGVRGSVPHQIWTMILIGGRWINQGFVAPTVYFLQVPNVVIHNIGHFLSVLAMVFLVLGWLALLQRRCWWATLLSLYGLIFWVMWAARIIPRYLIPISPILFVMVAIGMAQVIQFIAVKVIKLGVPKKLILWTPAICLSLIVAGNAIPYSVEVFVHKVYHRDYYDVARQGGIGELIDIGGYLQKNVTPGEMVYVNTGGMAQRVIFYLGGAKTDVPHMEGEKPRSLRVDRPEMGTDQNPELNRFLKMLEPSVRFAVVFSTLYAWPEWYFPLEPPPDAEKRHWWFLYERDASTGEFRHVIPPRDRDYAFGIPVSKMVFPTTSQSTDR